MVSDWSTVLIFMKIRQAKPLKLKPGVFLFFLPQIPLRALDFEILQKKTWPEPQCLKGFFCAEKRAYLTGAIGRKRKAFLMDKWL